VRHRAPTAQDLGHALVFLGRVEHVRVHLVRGGEISAATISDPLHAHSGLAVGVLCTAAAERVRRERGLDTGWACDTREKSIDLVVDTGWRARLLRLRLHFRPWRRWFLLLGLEKELHERERLERVKIELVWGRAHVLQELRTWRRLHRERHRDGEDRARGDVVVRIQGEALLFSCLDANKSDEEVSVRTD
jgi:hypothetical protein